MPNKMLIDASHPEETRVVVVRGNRIEEFDFESQDKKQLKGNIYLARVTRVEPSLQAAFVEYGGNRHGFLAFSEIHPDYYQIPVADRQALLRAEAEEAEQENHDEDHDGEERHDRNRGKRGRRRGGRSRDHGERKQEVAGGDDNADNSNEEGTESSNEDGGENTAAVEAVEATAEISVEAIEETAVQEGEAEKSPETANASDDETDASDDSAPTTIAASVDADVISEAVEETAVEAASDDNDRGMLEEVPSSNGDEHEVESVGAEDALEELRNRRKPARRQYKIQEVIKRRQILLVQVVKEERGNKGAALTTYLSLAGRYSVLMPNTARGGGISRKITNAQDRKRLKEVVADLDVPQGMGVILRTAGESRTKAEIKRDYEYLMRLWENVRNLTLESTAPALVYEEGSLIKRSVRDLYNKDIDEVLVAGEDGYREAKDFMRMLMPSHAKVVQPYRETTPIFVRSGIEAQLDRMVQPQVTLKSGGYLIINQTEALVSIDVNSGRSTKEHSIEETALHTNLEAAEEVARQLRLRDLAGLIVIDFIDMEENRNNRAVEKRLKDHLKNDRARIQVGRISHFGLLEMSRQRIRASVLESTMKPCPYCGGAGHVRSDSSVGLMVVRAIEEFLLKDFRCHVTVRTPAATALYVLNHKRSTLVELEKRFGVTVTIETDESVAAQHYTIARGAVAEKPEGFVDFVPQPVPIEPEEPEDEIIVDDDAAEENEQPQSSEQQTRNGEENGEGHRDRKRRKRRRRRGGKDRGEREQANTSAEELGDDLTSDQITESEEQSDDAEVGADTAALQTADSSEDTPAKKRRRGKRGGKRNRQENDEAAPEAVAEGEASQADAELADAATDTQIEQSEPIVAVVETQDVSQEAEVAEAQAAGEEPVAEKPKKPRRAPRSKKAIAKADSATAAKEASDAPAKADEVSPAKAEQAVATEEKPKAKPRATRRKSVAAETPAVPAVSSQAASEPVEPAEEEKPKRGGWWQRKGFF